MFDVRTRGGVYVKFNSDKITEVLLKIKQDVNELTDGDIDGIIAMTYSKLCTMGKKHISIETINDTLQDVLYNNGFKKTAEALIILRDVKRRMYLEKKDLSKKLVENYIGLNDWKVKENSNMGYSLQGLNNYLFNYISEEYWLNTIYPKHIRNAHNNGLIKIHDLGNVASYCTGWTLEQLFLDGFNGVSGKLECKPPKHFRTALGQVVNFLYTISGEAAGAVAFSNLDTYVAPFIRYDNLDYTEVRQAVQEFVYNMNVPTRVGFQQPFSNVTIDLTIPKSFVNKYVVFDGKYTGDTYGMFQKEADMFNRAFFEVMTEGDASGRVFSFPVITVNVTKEFDWDNENLAPFWQSCAKYGLPTFANYVNSDMNPDDVTSMCCFDGSQEVIIIEDDIENLASLEDLYDANKRHIMIQNFKDNKGCFSRAEVIKVPLITSMCELKIIDMLNNKVSDILVTGNHQFPIYRNSVKLLLEVKDIEHGDYLVSSCAHNYMVVNKKVLPEYTNEYVYCLEMEDDAYPYFMLGNGILTHNCRLRLDKRQLKFKGGGLFGAGGLTGSIGVVTMNLPRIAYLSKGNVESFYKILSDNMDLAKESLEIKRSIVEKYTEKGLYPYCERYLRKVKEGKKQYWANHFSTIGMIGANEMCLNMFGEDLTTGKSQAFTMEMLDFMRDKLADYQVETGNMYNLEQTPGEGTSYSLAINDKKTLKGIVTSGTEEVPYYTNSTQLPVGYSDDVFDILDIQDNICSKFTGGSACHLWIGEELTDIETVKSLVKVICNKYKIPYFSLTPTFSICPKHGYLPGNHIYCPLCDKEIAVKKGGDK